jgi:hypothetical protein
MRPGPAADRRSSGDSDSGQELPAAVPSPGPGSLGPSPSPAGRMGEAVECRRRSRAAAAQRNPAEIFPSRPPHGPRIARARRRRGGGSQLGYQYHEHRIGCADRRLGGHRYARAVTRTAVTRTAVTRTAVTRTAVTRTDDQARLARCRRTACEADVDPHEGVRGRFSVMSHVGPSSHEGRWARESALETKARASHQLESRLSKSPGSLLGDADRVRGCSIGRQCYAVTPERRRTVCSGGHE